MSPQREVPNSEFLRPWCFYNIRNINRRLLHNPTTIYQYQIISMRDKRLSQVLCALEVEIREKLEAVPLNWRFWSRSAMNCVWALKSQHQKNVISLLIIHYFYWCSNHDREIEASFCGRRNWTMSAANSSSAFSRCTGRIKEEPGPIPTQTRL